MPRKDDAPGLLGRLRAGGLRAGRGGVRSREEVVARPSRPSPEGMPGARERAATALGALYAGLAERKADSGLSRLGRRASAAGQGLLGSRGARATERVARWRGGAGLAVGGSAAGIGMGGLAGGRVDPALAASAGAHGALILWALVGGALARDREPEIPPEIAVEIVTSAEFAALVANAPQPQPVEPAALPPEEAVPPEPRPEPAPEPGAPPPPAEAPAPDAAPEAPEPAPAPPAPPPFEEPEAEAAPLLDAPPPAAAPPLAAERVAPTPAPPPPPEAQPDEAPSAAVVPDPEAAETPPERDEAAPEEAGTVLASEATPEETPPALDAPPVEALAPVVSPRPVARPERPPVEVAEPADPPQSPGTASEAESPGLESAIESALADALAAAEPPELAPEPTPAPAEEPAPAAPASPPLTGAEREGFRVAVQGCWSVDPGSEAARATVTVAFALDPEGRVVGDVRPLGASGGTDAGQQTAFQAARRAILRCQRDGYDLPPEKYDQWREVEMTFNPEGMRIR